MASPWIVGVKIAGRKLKMIRDKSRRVEKLLKDSSSMGSGGQGRRKEKAKDTRTTRFEERYSNRSPATALESLLGILASQINPQAHGYRCSFHHIVFQGLSNPQGTCVHSLLL